MVSRTPVRKRRAAGMSGTRLRTPTPTPVGYVTVYARVADRRNLYKTVFVRPVDGTPSNTQSLGLGLTGTVGRPVGWSAPTDLFCPGRVPNVSGCVGSCEPVYARTLGSRVASVDTIAHVCVHVWGVLLANACVSVSVYREGRVQWTRGSYRDPSPPGTRSMGRRDYRSTGSTWVGGVDGGIRHRVN